MSLRRSVAEAGLDYSALEAAVKDGSLRKTLEATGAAAEDLEEMVSLIEEHFSPGEIRGIMELCIFFQFYFSSFFLRHILGSQNCNRGVRPVFLVLTG